MTLVVWLTFDLRASVPVLAFQELSVWFLCLLSAAKLWQEQDGVIV